MLVEASPSRSVHDELSDLDATDVQQAAEAFQRLEGDERAGALSLAQFSEWLVEQAMSGTAGEAPSHQRVQRMFAKADLNGDGVVDFNEFLAMWRRTWRRVEKHDERRRRHGARHPNGQPADAPGPPADGAEIAPEEANAHADTSAAPWVVAREAALREEEARLDAARTLEAARLHARYQMTDALVDLTDDELDELEAELLGRGVSRAVETLDVEAARSSLNLLALRVGKLFSPAEVESLLQDLRARPESAADGGRFPAAELVAELRSRALRSRPYTVPTI
jgi:hypothetical protein